MNDERKLELDILVLIERDLIKENDTIHHLRLDLQEREKRYDTLKAWWIKLKAEVANKP